MLFSLVKKFFQIFHSYYEKQEICKNSSAKSAYNTGKKSIIEICIFIPKRYVFLFLYWKFFFMHAAVLIHRKKSIISRYALISCIFFLLHVKFYQIQETLEICNANSFVISDNKIIFAPLDRFFFHDYAHIKISFFIKFRDSPFLLLYGRIVLH